MARPTPYSVSEDGRNYVCALCGTVIPDGVAVLAVWSDDDVLLGVRAEDGDGHNRHHCGQPVAGAEMTAAERVQARNEERSYLTEAGT